MDFFHGSPFTPYIEQSRSLAMQVSPVTRVLSGLVDVNPISIVCDGVEDSPRKLLVFCDQHRHGRHSTIELHFLLEAFQSAIEAETDLAEGNIPVQYPYFRRARNVTRLQSTLNLTTEAAGSRIFCGASLFRFESDVIASSIFPCLHERE